MRTSTLEHAACTMRRTVRHVLAATVRQQEYGNRLRPILPSLFYLLSLGYFPTSEFNSCNVESPTTRCMTRPASFDRSPIDDIASPRPIKILRDFRRWYDASPSTNQRGFDDKSVGTIDSFCNCALPCQS